MIETVATAAKLAPGALDLIGKMIDSGNMSESALAPEKNSQYNEFINLLKFNAENNQKFLMMKFMGMFTQDNYNEFDEKVKKDKREYIELLKILEDPVEAKKKTEKKVLGIKYSETTVSLEKEKIKGDKKENDQS